MMSYFFSFNALLFGRTHVARERTILLQMVCVVLLFFWHHLYYHTEAPQDHVLDTAAANTGIVDPLGLDIFSGGSFDKLTSAATAFNALIEVPSLIINQCPESDIGSMIASSWAGIISVSCLLSIFSKLHGILFSNLNPPPFH